VNGETCNPLSSARVLVVDPWASGQWSLQCLSSMSLR
jgi:hypothetical protein